MYTEQSKKKTIDLMSINPSVLAELSTDVKVKLLNSDHFIDLTSSGRCIARVFIGSKVERKVFNYRNYGSVDAAILSALKWCDRKYTHLEKGSSIKPPTITTVTKYNPRTKKEDYIVQLSYYDFINCRNDIIQLIHANTQPTEHQKEHMMLTAQWISDGIISAAIYGKVYLKMQYIHWRKYALYTDGKPEINYNEL